MSLNEKMTALADAVRSKANRSGTLTIDAMTAAVNGLAVGTPTTKSLTVTPTKSDQTFSSSDLGVNTYYSTVTVNAIPAEYITTTDANALPGDILEGKTAYANGIKFTGSMTDYGDVVKKFNNISDTLSIHAGGYFNTIKVTLTKKELTITPSAKTQYFDVFTDEEDDVFYSKVTVDPIPTEYITTTDATATAGAILEGKTAYVNGKKVTGTYIEVSEDDVRDGVRFGANSPYGGEKTGRFTFDATADAEDIAPGKTAYAVGMKVTGAMPSKEAETYTPGTADITIKSGVYLAEDQTIKGDSNLAAENIKQGVSIFDVEGTFTADANATAEDIAKDKTAYVNGEKITGTHTCGGGVSRLYTSAGGGPLNRLYTELSPEFSNGPMQTPARRGVYNDIHASNNSLWYARNGESGEYRYRSRKLPLSEGWTLCRDGIAVREGKLHAINADASNDNFSFTLFPDSPANITQLGFVYDSRRWCLDDSDHAIIFSPHDGECKPAVLSDIHVSKLLNQKTGGGGYQFSQAAISSSGRAILLWADPQDYQPQIPHFEYVGNDVSFVNYYYHEYEDYGWGGGAYRLALTADGTLYVQNASSMENSWEAVPNAPKFRTGNFLGFCEMGVNEDWETGEMRPYDNNVALHIAQDGTLWKIRATGDSSGNLTGVVTEQIDSRTQWNYVPPELGRDSKSYAQCGSTLYVIKSDGADSMNISWEECYIQPSGKLIATSHDDSFLWFAEDDAAVDVTGLGEI